MGGGAADRGGDCARTGSENAEPDAAGGVDAYDDGATVGGADAGTVDAVEPKRPRISSTALFLAVAVGGRADAGPFGVEDDSPKISSSRSLFVFVAT